MLVMEKLSDELTVDEIAEFTNKFMGRHLLKILKAVELALNELGPQNVYSIISNNITKHQGLSSTDIVHFHNIHWHSKNLALRHLRDISHQKPAVWTLHDMWPLTGHCIYSFGCERWKTGCGNCPHLDVYIRVRRDTTAALWQIKERIYGESSLTLVSPSKWLANLVADSPLLKRFRIEHIPNGIDTKIFKPCDAARGKLLPQQEFVGHQVVLFASPSLDDPRKGYNFFEEAMLALYDHFFVKNLLIMTFGSGHVTKRLSSRFPTIEMGKIDDTHTMAQIYSAADLFVMPSLYDNLPNMILESLACGTPVACFNTGGIPEIVKHGYNGYLARHKDVGDLAVGIMETLHASKEMRSNSVATISKSFTVDLQVRRHLDLYRQLLD